MELDNHFEATESEAVLVGTVGERLAEAREASGLSLRDLSAETSIQSHLLALLEQDRFSEFPAEVIARGFLRNYARQLGIDDQDIIAHYLTQTGLDQPTASRDAVVSFSVPAFREAAAPRFRMPDTSRMSTVAYAVVISVFLIALAVTVVMFSGDESGAEASFAPAPNGDAWRPAGNTASDWRTVREN